MLNLQEISNTKKLYELKMPDGTELSLTMPTQAMFQKMMGLQSIAADKPMEALDGIYGILTDILNLNTQKKVYKQEEVMDALDISLAMLVITDYTQTITNILGE